MATFFFPGEVSGEVESVGEGKDEGNVREGGVVDEPSEDEGEGEEYEGVGDEPSEESEEPSKEGVEDELSEDCEEESDGAPLRFSLI